MGFHDDLADPDNGAYKDSPPAALFGMDLDHLDSLQQEKCDLFEEVSPINHVTPDDAPVHDWESTALRQVFMV
ncbi:MAG: hypothetical protein KC944_16100 [Candidatus Omnitrophica bacterium]|nr:hypothetical protein [Candidatus Omnitrophota bacterium]MCB9769475.1 hypothetical protein [Candidatus Omnitrophota bacterium]